MIKYFIKDKMNILYSSKIYTKSMEKSLMTEFKNKEYIYIIDINIPMIDNDNESYNFIKDFCNIMTIENKIILFDTYQFIASLETVGSYVYYSACLNILHDLLISLGFKNINNIYGNLNTPLYIYCNSKQGLELYNTLYNL